jgi:hypothetical protein
VDGKNAKNWIIRSQSPYFVMIEVGGGSTTKRLSGSNEGDINPDES